MKLELNGKKVAILVNDGFEQVELTRPKAAERKPLSFTRQRQSSRLGRNGVGKKFPSGHATEHASPPDFDALLLPGGVMNPDKLRLQPRAIEFIRGFAEAGKPIAAICHGMWTLIDAGVVQGR